MEYPAPRIGWTKFASTFSLRSLAFSKDVQRNILLLLPDFYPMKQRLSRIDVLGRLFRYTFQRDEG